MSKVGSANLQRNLQLASASDCQKNGEFHVTHSDTILRVGGSLATIQSGYHQTPRAHANIALAQSCARVLR